MWQPQEHDEEVNWKRKTVSYNEGKKERGPHADYEFNLQTAYKFIEKVQTYLKNGVNITITGNNTLPKSLLVISWTPPRTAPVGNWINSIFLHQDRFTFGKELETVFNHYMSKAESFEKRFPHY